MKTYEYNIVARLVHDGEPVPGNNSELSVRYLMEHCYTREEMWREKCFALLLDSRNHIIGHTLVSVGGTSATIVDVKVVAKAALDCLAHAVILSHNHPSGNSMPGKLDTDMTHRIKNALACLDIKLLDHIIVTEDEYYSFNDEKTYPIRKDNPANS